MIRSANEKDLVTIRDLIESVPGLWHGEWRQDALERAIQASGGLAFVWEGQGYILGFNCAHDVGFLNYLSLLVVAESARGTGIGKALIVHTIEELAARACATLISDVWQAAVGFYRSLGWSSPGAVLLRHRLNLTQQ